MLSSQNRGTIMAYPLNNYEYLRDYPNSYANIVAQVCKQTDGDIALVLVAAPVLKGALDAVLQYWISAIDGEPADNFPVNALNQINGYTGENEQNAYRVGLVLGSTGQVAQMYAIPDYAPAMWSLFSYWEGTE